MQKLIEVIPLLLFGNAMLAFCVFFFFQASTILKIMGKSNSASADRTGDPNSFQANFFRFLQGDLFPKLMRKWMASLYWVGLSFLALFIATVFLDVG